MALEHSTIFATEMIQNLTQTILDLQQELSKANDKLKKIEEVFNKSEMFKLEELLEIDECLEINQIIKGEE